METLPLCKKVLMTSSIIVGMAAAGFSQPQRLQVDSFTVSETTLWKGPINIQWLGLYFGSGLARDGSFILGVNRDLKILVDRKDLCYL